MTLIDSGVGTAGDPLTTPVVLCVYNRPALTQKVLAVLSRVRPRHILVIADGPRSEQPRDREKCDAVINLIRSIDWPTRVEWNVAPNNMGLRSRIQSGLSWVFSRVQEAIILEDDCVPHPSFFHYCTELLDRYRDDPRIALICGTNFKFEVDSGPASYFYSRYPLIWGWASWRRTWEQYDPELRDWPKLRETSWLADYLGDPLAAAYWRAVFDHVRAGLNTWDFSLAFSCWRAGALVVQPAQNLVTNIGFGADGTFTRAPDAILARMPVHEMHFPLVHPDRVERAVACDDKTEEIAFSSSARKQLQRLEAARQAGAAPRIWKPITRSQ